MHELSLVQELLSQVMKVAEEHKAHKVNKIEVLIGPFAGVVLDSFSFAFDTLKQENPLLKNTVLSIETPRARFRCTSCKATIEQDVDEGLALPFAGPVLVSARSCPLCKKGELYPEGGDEILLIQIELE